jgi:hypothetical protein
MNAAVPLRIRARTSLASPGCPGVSRVGLLALIVALTGCGRGLYGDSHPLPVSTSRLGDASFIADAVPSRSGNPAADAAPADAAAPDIAIAADVAPPTAEAATPDAAAVMLPAATVWKPCGRLGSQWPNALLHSADGKRLLLATPEGFFDSYPLDGGEQKSYFVDTHVLTRIAVSRDGSRVAGVGDDLLMVWRADQFDPGIATLGSRSLHALQFSPTAPDLLLATTDGGGDAVGLWRFTVQGDSGSLVLERQFPGSPDAAFTADGAALLLVDGKSIATVDLQGRVKKKVDLAQAIASPVFSTDAALVAGMAGTDLLVQRTSDGVISWRKPLPGPAARLFFLGGGRGLLAVAGTRLQVYQPDGSTPAPLSLPRPLLLADPAPDGSALAGLDDDGTLVRYALADGESLPAGPMRELTGKGDSWTVSLSPDGRFLAGNPYPALMWDLGTRLVTRRLAENGEVEWSPRGDQLALAAAQTCWLVRLGDHSMVQLTDERCSMGLVYAPDVRHLAGVHNDRQTGRSSIEIFSAEGTWQQRLTTRVSEPAVRFSPRGDLLASSGHELWNTSDWSPRWQQPVDPELFPEDPPPVDPNMLANDNWVVFSPDGQQVLMSRSQSKDFGAVRRTVARLHDASTGKELRHFGQELARRPSFSPDGSWLAAGDTVWHLASSTRRPLGPGVAISVFLADGRIASSRPDGTVLLSCPTAP